MRVIIVPSEVSLNFWIFVWVVLAVIVLGVFFWSMEILFRQKRAWKALANKYNMQYESNALLLSPGVSGRIKGYQVDLFAEEQPAEDVRRRQFRTVIMVHIENAYPSSGIAGTPLYKEFINSINLPEIYTPEHKGWNDRNVLHTKDKQALKEFMEASPERWPALSKLLKIKNADAFFIFDDKEAYFRMETAEPLDDLEFLNKRILGIIAQCEKLDPGK